MSRSTRRQAASHVLASRLVDLLSIAGAAFALDAASKWLILNVVMQPPRAIPLLPVLDLTLGFNTGVSFGLFGGGAARWALSVFSVVVAGALAWWATKADRRLLIAAIGLVMGGAIGNAIDRIRFGYVVDFVHLHAGPWSFYVFNVADAAITIGVVILLVRALIGRSDGQTESAKDA